MDYNNELYGNLKQHKVQDALLLTGELVFKKHFDMLQKTWVRAIACIGEYTDVCFMKWHDCIKDIVVFIENDEVDVYHVMKITTKLCILFQNNIQYNVIPKLTIPQLRTKTIGYFETTLSQKGEEYFLPILPKPINEKDFCLKIIGGLVKLWSDKKPTDFRNAVEYLARKDYVIESIHTETGSSIVAFLWEFMRLYEPAVANDIYTIYKTGFKKKDKSWRNNLLYGIHNYLNQKYNAISWDMRENSLIDNTTLVAKEVWYHILKKHKIVPEKKETDKMSVFENYYPTKMKPSYNNNTDEPYKREPRVISMENNDSRRVGKAFGSVANTDS
jgi:hypothetical protein